MSITVQVKMLLLPHRLTTAIETKVETRNGVDTLTGIAKNADPVYKLVTKLVADDQGVKNKMTSEEPQAK